MIEDYSHVSPEYARHLELMCKLDDISMAIAALGEIIKSHSAIGAINNAVQKFQSENLPTPDNNLPDGSPL